ncbi:hypothetical protein [Caenispirillum bisanense]|uniref:hypothetical protein n=1 Tax=Caenispirillum bisanense TaxID=414052 RepID=UPI0031DDA00E
MTGIERIRVELEKTGYPLELRCNRLFRNQEWFTLDHPYYLDADENKGREIDAFILKNFVQENDKKVFNLNIALSVEIKKSASKPWVVLTDDSSGSPPESVIHATLARLHIQEIWFRELLDNHHLKRFKRTGRSACQAYLSGQESEFNDKKKANDPSRNHQTFNAFVSCFKAASELQKHQQGQNNQDLWTKESKKSYFCGISHGLVVVQGGLYEAYIDSYGEMIIEEKSHIPYIFNYVSEKYAYKSLLVDIVHFDNLELYLSDYTSWGNECAKWGLSQL